MIYIIEKLITCALRIYTYFQVYRFQFHHAYFVLYFWGAKDQRGKGAKEKGAKVPRCKVQRCKCAKLTAKKKGDKQASKVTSSLFELLVAARNKQTPIQALRKICSCYSKS